MADRSAKCLLLLMICSTHISGEDVCHSSDLKAMMVRLRDFTTKSDDSIKAMQARIAELEQTNTILNNKIHRLTLDSQEAITMLEEKNTNLENTIQNLTQQQQQQHADIESLKNGNSTETVAFIARTPSNTDPDSGQVLVFVTEELDTQNCYDISTGKFKAPVAGTYLFSVQICVRSGSGIYYSIKSSNAGKNLHARSFHGGNYHNSECSSVTTLIRLQEMDTVWVESGSTTGNINEIYVDNYAWNMFLGTLLVS